MNLKIKLNNKRTKSGTIISNIVEIDSTRAIKSKKSLKLGSFIKPTCGIQILFINRERLLKSLARGVKFSDAARRLLNNELKLILQN